MKKLRPLLCLLLLACSSDDDPQLFFEPSEFDSNVLNKLAESTPLVATYFEGYDFPLTRPYFILMDHTASGETTGYIVNPAFEIPASQRVNTSGEIEIYRYDEIVAQAKEDMQGGLFAFSYVINGVSHFLANYTVKDGFYWEYKDKDFNAVPGLVIHEMMHMYQFESWTFPGTNTQGEYPLSEEIVTWHLLLYDLMSAAYKVEAEDYDKFLGYYVAIWDRLLSLDNTDEQVMLNQGHGIEFIEGPARYVEHFILKDTFYPSINDDPTHGWRNALATATDAPTLQQGLLRRGFYHQGAIAIHMLKTRGVNVEDQLISGTTPFETARQYLNMSSTDLETALADAQAQVNWDQYQEEAVRIFEIIGE